MVETTNHTFSLFLLSPNNYILSNIPTADNSQPLIFSTDITAGQPARDSNDDDSTTDYDKVYSDNDKYDSFDILSRSCQKVNQAEGHKHTITPYLLLEDQSLEDADYPDYSSKSYCQNRDSRPFNRTANDCTKLKMNEKGSWIPTTTNTSPPDKCTSKFFGPAPPPDHPRYKPQYNHFSHPIPSCSKDSAFVSDDATNDTESTIDDALDATESIVLDDIDKKSDDDDDDDEFYLNRGPSAPFTLRKFPRDINNNATPTDEAKPAANGTTSTIDPII